MPVMDKHAIATTALASATTLASPDWWAAQRARRRMRSAVAAARHTVKVARRTGSPVGDLSTLVRQLEVAARSADALARAHAHYPTRSGPAHVELRRIEEAAAHVHHAAVRSPDSVAKGEADPLVHAVHLEAAALRAGVRATMVSRRPV